MNETPKFKRSGFFFFLVMILLYLLPKAGVDFVEANERIRLEKNRQENLQKLTAVVESNSKEAARLAQEIKGSQYMVSLEKKTKQSAVFGLSLYLLILIGLFWSWQTKKVEGDTTLQKV